VTPQLPPAEREEIVAQLGEYFARDHLSLDEYERRVVEAYRAPNREALVALMNDLPALAPADATAVAVPSPGYAAPAPKRFAAFMSGVARKGAWLVPSRVRAIAVMGGVELDLREATLTAKVTEIHATAVMGGIEITVSPGTRVEADGFAFMGAFEDHLAQTAPADLSAPLVRLHGFAFMGAVEVKVEP
jgi:hypothetical protein